MTPSNTEAEALLSLVIRHVCEVMNAPLFGGDNNRPIDAGEAGDNPVH